MQSIDTIFALSSGLLPSGIAVVRLSGPHVRDALTRIMGKLPRARAAELRTMRDASGSILDRGIAVFFPQPASFTGEDCAEFSLHGGRAVVAAVLRALSDMPGCRQAGAGEFTKRAFLNGKLDLTEAEALADLIAAETEAQRRFALGNSSGLQRELYASWRSRLIHARAMIEAELDFADEGDVPDSVADVWGDMGLLAGELRRHVASFHSGEIVRDGLQVVIMGPPNAGKSSLINYLAQRDMAIVSDEPGTTRDLVEVSIDVGGAKIVLTDTAGLRADPGKVEALGIDRAMERARHADLVLWLRDLSLSVQPRLLVDEVAPVWEVGTKADLAVEGAPVAYRISTRTGEGLEGLLAALCACAHGLGAQVGDVVPFRARHVSLLTAGLDHLVESIEAAGSPPEVRAEGLRRATTALEEVVGHVRVEDLLGSIFSQFCIGK